MHIKQSPRTHAKDGPNPICLRGTRKYCSVAAAARQENVFFPDVFLQTRKGGGGKYDRVQSKKDDTFEERRSHSAQKVSPGKEREMCVSHGGRKKVTDP